MNRRPSLLHWAEFVRRNPSAWWRSRCNAVVLWLGPWIELLGMPMLVTEAISRDQNLHPYQTDPISLIWKDFAMKRGGGQ